MLPIWQWSAKILLQLKMYRYLNGRHTPSFAQTSLVVIETSELQTLVSLGLVPTHSYMGSGSLDRMLRDDLRDLNWTRQHHTNQWDIMVDVTCQLQDSHRRFLRAWRCPTRVLPCTGHLRRTGWATDRRRRYSGSTTRHWTGRPGSGTSGRLPMCMAGIQIKGPCNLYPTTTRQLCMWCRSLEMMNFITMTFWLNYWETGLTQHLVSRPPSPDSMADYDVIMRMQIRSLTLSQTDVVSATHRAHRSFIRS